MTYPTNATGGKGLPKDIINGAFLEPILGYRELDSSLGCKVFASVKIKEAAAYVPLAVARAARTQFFDHVSISILDSRQPAQCVAASLVLVALF